jgi:6-pyruvoyltetrahydropterin/6-carboxytetrahydropterin synthase
VSSDWAQTYEGSYAIVKEIQWDMGHRVPMHESKCKNPHGHRYKLEVYLRGGIVTEAGAPDEGMLVDFGFLKGLMMEKVHDVLDHGFMVAGSDEDMVSALAYGIDWKVIEVPFIPTAENIAAWCWTQLYDDVKRLGRGHLELDCVKLWETPTSIAIYTGPERTY